MAQLPRLPDEESVTLQQTAEEKTPETLLNSLPIIDLAGIDGPDHERICQRMAEACETWGFFHLINHGIGRSLFQRTKNVTMEFFHSPEEEKSKIRVQVFEGWNHSKNKVEGSEMAQKDTVEHTFLQFYPERQICDRYPEQPPSYIPTLKEYTKELKLLGEKILRLLSETLGLAPEALETAMIGGSATQSVHSAVRSNFYGLNEQGDALPNLCHAHNDPGFLTFLLADDAPGLELKRDDGGWLLVDPIPGGLIVNVADMLEVCSNGRFKSVYHRGLPASKQERLTLANFQMPPMDAVIAPMASLVDETHPPLFKTFTFGEYVMASVKRGLDGSRGLEAFKL